jgi:UDP-N-acetylglucosamine 2-epimerase (non-hydrolysing)
MIDTLVAFENEITASTVLDRYSIQPKQFVLMTMHRPATVDNAAGLKLIIDVIRSIAPLKVVFPVHPRTLAKFEHYSLKHSLLKLPNLILSEPMGYFDFQKLVAESRFILTDSGGIQEESTFKQVPCITIRPNTERPITCEIGTNQLVDSDLSMILEAINKIDAGYSKIPQLWDGYATERVLNIFK